MTFYAGYELFRSVMYLTDCVAAGPGAANDFYATAPKTLLEFHPLYVTVSRLVQVFAKHAVIHKNQALVGCRDNSVVCFCAFHVGFVEAIDQSFDILVVGQDVE